jgi:L-amino acid N-acyltransferase YncA
VSVVVRDASADDAAGIAAIYNHYIAETVVTFEEEPVEGNDVVARMADVRAASLPWLVAEESSRLLGYAYAARWNKRSAYRHSVETTVYLAPEHTGRGLGSLLYAELFRRLEALGIHAVIGGIALPNDASVALHEKLGMRKVAHFPEVGFKLGRWVDVGYWQLEL